jgi:hypothetical protein
LQIRQRRHWNRLHLASYLNVKETDGKFLKLMRAQQAIKHNSLSNIDDHELIEDRELLEEVPILATATTSFRFASRADELYDKIDFSAVAKIIVERQ